MMAMPFVVVGAIAGGLIYAYWRAQKNTDAKEARGRTASADMRDTHGQRERASEH
jgi:hypothetical protein